MKNKEKKLLADIIKYVTENPEHNFDIKMDDGKMSIIWSNDTVMDYLTKEVNPEIYYNDYGLECQNVKNNMTKVTGCLWFGLIYSVVVETKDVENINIKYLLEDYIWNN